MPLKGKCRAEICRAASRRATAGAAVMARAGSGSLQPCQLGLELEAELGPLLLGQPERHLGEERAIEPGVHRRPGQDLRATRLGEQDGQELPDLLRIWPAVGARLSAKQLQLAAPDRLRRAVVRHGIPLPDREPTQTLVIRVGGARIAQPLPTEEARRL